MRIKLFFFLEYIVLYDVRADILSGLKAIISVWMTNNALEPLKIVTTMS